MATSDQKVPLILDTDIGTDIDDAVALAYLLGQPRCELLGVTTVTGNVMVAVPRRWTEYALRPYFVGGAGMMRVQRQDYFDVFNIANLYAATDIGGGATGFVTNGVGICWEARYFRAISRQSQTSGVTFGPEELSFWRASMAIAIRY